MAVRRTTRKQVRERKTETPRTPPLKPIESPPTEGFKEALYKELQYMDQSKREAKRLPEYTLLIELQRHVSETLNALCQDGRIKTGQTINDKYISTTYGTDEQMG